MNIDIFKIIKLAFALIEDTELKNNPTFQIVKQVADSVDRPPVNPELKTLNSELYTERRDA